MNIGPAFVQIINFKLQNWNLALELYCLPILFIVLHTGKNFALNFEYDKMQVIGNFHTFREFLIYF